MTNKDDIVEKETLSKVADESLTLKDVKAVFVIGRISVTEVGISARSDGSVNVQLLMEKLGGGGHFISAATSKEGVSLQEMRKNLNKTLELYLNVPVLLSEPPPAPPSLRVLRALLQAQEPDWQVL